MLAILSRSFETGMNKFGTFYHLSIKVCYDKISSSFRGDFILLVKLQFKKYLFSALISINSVQMVSIKFFDNLVHAQNS